MTLTNYLNHYQTRVNRALTHYLSALTSSSPRLQQAMHYVTLTHGKRIRPILLYATGELLGATNNVLLDQAACSIELIHAYSLVHDDLPAMDDDILRRGSPTCHIEFDEATAILTGDALQSLAFELLAQGQSHTNTLAQTRLKMVSVLAKAIGAEGMVGGQSIDILAHQTQLDETALDHMHQCKTGALIQASIHLGALAADHVSPNQLSCLKQYAACVGLAFQIQDDILDVTGKSSQLGKNTHKDRSSTYPNLLGLAHAKAKVKSLHEQALAHLEDFSDQANRLRQLASFIIERKY